MMVVVILGRQWNGWQVYASVDSSVLIQFEKYDFVETHEGPTSLVDLDDLDDTRFKAFGLLAFGHLNVLNVAVT